MYIIKSQQTNLVNLKMTTIEVSAVHCLDSIQFNKKTHLHSINVFCQKKFFKLIRYPIQFIFAVQYWEKIRIYIFTTSKCILNKIQINNNTIGLNY